MRFCHIKHSLHKSHSFIKRFGLQLLFLTIIVMMAHPRLLMGAGYPQFIFEAPESLEPLAAQLKEIKPQSLQRMMDFMGLQQPGPPIRVILAPNGSPLAQEAPEWMSGYAVSHVSTIVLLTDRVLTYPNDSLNEVFLHEIGHILAHRASGEQLLPRWFDEGLAMMAARRWDLEDRARLVWAMVSDTQISLNDLNTLFVKDEASVRRAYVLAYAFTLDLLEHTGQDTPKRILAKVQQGIPFPEAFAQTTFMTLTQAEEQFWSRQTLWNRWIPVATSSGMVWLAITLLTFLAFTRQRKRAAAIKKQWREDDFDL
jgi:Peptidase MA superfamily